MDVLFVLMEMHEEERLRMPAGTSTFREWMGGTADVAETRSLGSTGGPDMGV